MLRFINTVLWMMCFCLPLILTSQEKEATVSIESDSIQQEKNLFLITKNTGTEIILRWAPATPAIWHLSNYDGYVLERAIFKDTTDFKDKEYIALTDTLRPFTEDVWRQRFEADRSDTYVAMAAQAVYGKRPELSKSDDESSFLEKADEFENLYAVALLAADYSATAAEASGLRFEDKDLRPGYTYLYKLRSLADSEAYPITPAYAVVRVDEIDAEPIIKIDELNEYEGAVELKWNRSINSERFTAYYIEKSSDKGNTWKRLNKTPYLSSGIEGDSLSRYADYYYVDSVAQNYVPYNYRLIGITAFGELSAPSEMLTGMGRDRTAPALPYNIVIESQDAEHMLITWEYPDEVSDDFQGFLIARSTKVDGNSIQLTDEPLPPGTRSFIDEGFDELDNNFYFIGAVDTAGNGAVAFPVHGGYIDSIPPAPPTGLTGSIDTNGVVTINWEQGTERDLIGYRIHFANQDDHVFMSNTNELITETSFSDTIPLNVLTEEIYYKLVAFDHKHNASDYSEMLTLKKPDLVPPVAPIFVAYEIKEDHIYLKWAQSTSHDLLSTHLYRRMLPDGEYEEIYMVTDHQDTYGEMKDSTTVAGNKYEYRIEAKDDDGLVSLETFTYQLYSIDFSQIPIVEKINITLNKEANSADLNWSYPYEGEFIFLIYKAEDGGPFRTIAKMKSTDLNFSDPRIKEGHSYEYAIRVNYRDKGKSAFSKYAGLNDVSF